jgi:hypothetical protein
MVVGHRHLNRLLEVDPHTRRRLLRGGRLNAQSEQENRLGREP